MDNKKILKYIFIILFSSFVICYVIEESGYYEYKLKNKTVLTNESIAKFEKDLEEGKDVTLEDYLVETELDYTSALTRGTNKVSLKVNKILKRVVEGIFQVLSSFVEE